MHTEADYESIPVRNLLKDYPVRMHFKKDLYKTDDLKKFPLLDVTNKALDALSKHEGKEFDGFEVSFDKNHEDTFRVRSENTGVFEVRALHDFHTNTYAIFSTVGNFLLTYWNCEHVSVSRSKIQKETDHAH